MRPFPRRLTPILSVALFAAALAGCTTTTLSPPPEQAAPAVTPTLPSAYPPSAVVGRWGLAAYHVDTDRQRTEAAALNACTQPYVVTLGPTGGVMMHLADQATPSELRLKGAPGGKTYIGPADDPPGGMQDRLIEQLDERVMILRWVDPEVQGRYGTMVYVRCPAEGLRKPRRPVAKPKTKPKPKPAG